MERMQWSLLLVLIAVKAARALQPLPLPPYHETQGIPTARRIRNLEQALDSGRIVGGIPVAIGAHPYLGGLIVHLADGRTSMCGCSMLSHTRAVTAAHCWWDGRSQARALTLVYGSDRLFSGGVRLSITNTSAIEMQNFNPATYSADIAIISHPYVEYSAHINRVLLPTGNNQYEDMWARAVGYGRTTRDPFVPQLMDKREVRLRVISNLECRRTWAAVMVDIGTLCTESAHGMSVCAGDSGGPLVIDTDAGSTLIGIVSFGADAACDLYFPAGFTRVANFAHWIRQRI